MSRKAARESAMKLLFEISYRMDEADSILNNFFEEKKLDENDREYINTTVRDTLSRIESIDGTIERHSKGWKVNRLARVDLAILRLAVCELSEGVTPQSVIINEAVELAKKYGSEKSGRYINGLLAGIVKEKQDV